MADVAVPGVMEAITSATFEVHGHPVFLRGRDQGRLGSLVRRGHPVVRSHPELFQPLKLPLDLEDER